MKKIAFFTLLVGAIALTYVITNNSFFKQSSITGKSLPEQHPKIYGAMKHYHEFAKNQHTGKVEIKDIMTSRKAVVETSKEKSACSDGTQDILWEGMGPNNVGGRTRALLVDKDDRNLLISGGVGGGIYVSKDRGENWTPYTGENYEVFAPVRSVAQSADGSIYVGTGELIEDGINYGAYTSKTPGSGVWKSTDRGNSFQLLEATDPGYFSNRSDVRSGEWAFIMSIATHPTDPNILFVGTNRGLYKSTDAGASFQKMDNVLSANGIVYEVIYTKENKVYVLQGASLFKSDDGNTFVDITNNPGLAMHVGHKRMAISPTDPNHIYIVTQQRIIGNVLHSSDGGESWEIIGKGGDGSFNPCAGFGQCWFDLALAVDPANPERILLGGVFLYSWAKDIGWTQLDDYDGGSDNPQDFYYIHPDKHEIVFDPHDPNRVYILSDGGVTRSDNAGDIRPFFRTANKGYVTTQFYGVAATYEGQPIAGAQDNGTSYIDFAQNTILSADHVLGGDGGYTAASLFQPNILFAESQNANMGRSSNGGEGFSPFFDQNISEDMSGSSPFITSFFLFENFNDYAFKISDTQIGSFFTGGNSGNLWMAPDILNVSHVPVWENLGSFGLGRPLGDVSFSSDGSNLFACSRSGNILRVKELNHEVDPQSKALIDRSYKSLTFTDPAFEGRTTSGIAMHPNNPLGEVIITAGNYGNGEYIWISQNANSQPNQIEFESLQKNLPPIPIHDVLLNPLSVEHYVIVATEQGIWSYNKNEDCWKEQNQGMGRLPIHQIILVPMRDVACPVLYAGTHGKGVFRSTVFANPILCDVERYWTRFANTEQNENLEKQVKVYPNPASDFCTVDIDLTKPTKNLKLTIFNLNGQVMNEVDLGDQPAGKLSQNLNLNGLSAGNYMIYVFSDDLITTKQLVVID